MPATDQRSAHSHDEQERVGLDPHGRGCAPRPSACRRATRAAAGRTSSAMPRTRSTAMAGCGTWVPERQAPPGLPPLAAARIDGETSTTSSRPSSGWARGATSQWPEVLRRSSRPRPGPATTTGGRRGGRRTSAGGRRAAPSRGRPAAPWPSCAARRPRRRCRRACGTGRRRAARAAAAARRRAGAGSTTARASASRASRTTPPSGSAPGAPQAAPRSIVTTRRPAPASEVRPSPAPSSSSPTAATSTPRRRRGRGGRPRPGAGPGLGRRGHVADLAEQVDSCFTLRTKSPPDSSSSSTTSAKLSPAAQA